ncbi:hypothetical protein JG687_00019339 [Phytophthora cactorum]|uniref:Uncharacterized protein n=1 Tax=Phytophthora cactorum TaxID=29920 RepID=A0A329RR48_9STRA|nr:hypothetical protein Pcac1_g28861 [Phytophthora cactorum]KAG2759299.1 hypothetical protein Pcac1_g28644 [Phytophthora cactorum]KAG2796237.1 hypothetical protein PC111_g21812 [Phytophthora cactorum]KAG2798617.1 hypothetical protein PC112_g21270 [Phytophthora cactorum]KAG2827755.1 hypothetical protein PC113_g21575 [Phytophthora cactorum]
MKLATVFSGCHLELANDLLESLEAVYVIGLGVDMTEFAAEDAKVVTDVLECWGV